MLTIGNIAQLYGHVNSKAKYFCYNRLDRDERKPPQWAHEPVSNQGFEKVDSIHANIVALIVYRLAIDSIV